MPGERDLNALLQNMKPEMHEGVFVFCSISEDKEIPTTLRPVHIFREREGTAFIIRREEAEAAGLAYQFESRLITLTVHSSLEAVGLLAAITGRLTDAGISVNAVSAFYHDHLFVPSSASSTKHVQASVAGVGTLPGPHPRCNLVSLQTDLLDAQAQISTHNCDQLARRANQSNLSSPFRKNIPLSFSRKSPA